MEGYLTINELAEKWGLAPRTIQMMCSRGRIPGAIKFGSVWAVPIEAKRPMDNRVKSGAYRDWRKKAAQNRDWEEHYK